MSKEFFLCNRGRCCPVLKFNKKTKLWELIDKDQKIIFTEEQLKNLQFKLNLEFV